MVERLRKTDFENPAFNSTLRIIAFIDEKDAELREVQDAILNGLPTLAKQLAETNIRVGVASCATAV